MITLNIKKHLAIGLVCCGIATAMTGCQDLFETDSDRQIFDPALDQKTDSMFYTLGILKGLQQVADQYVMTGEMRGDLVQTNQYTETDLRRLADFTADVTNKYDSAYLYYRIINNCNYYIAHRDTSLRTGSRQVTLPEYAEALAVRAWTYMQLCKTYGSVPFYTDPLTSIGDANSKLNSMDLQGVCDALMPELIKFSGTQVPDYGEMTAGVLSSSSSSDNPVEKRVRSKFAMLPIDLVMGDLYLETNQYDKAAKSYFRYLRDNEMILDDAYIDPTSDNIMTLMRDKMPASMYITTAGFQWDAIFNEASTYDLISLVPMAANQLRGCVTELPRYFGYDFYSTTGGGATSTKRYLIERQIDASQAYVALSDSQAYYYLPNEPIGASTTVSVADLGDLRRHQTFLQVSKDDSLFYVMRKFRSANIPIYRTATVYLRLAEAVNRMGHPDIAFAILKDGINVDITDYLQVGDSTDIEAGRYITRNSYALLTNEVPFLSQENMALFEENYGIHSRGCGYTRGKYSPYQFHTVVGKKLDELKRLGVTPTGTAADTINAMEDILCDEMALELAFEGNRFGDLTRLARHKNDAQLYGANYGSQWLANKLAYKKPAVSLLDEKNWYLPFK
ncbi:MAG: RagB/SusD family nutrient uptake outer membrane protein [Prevotella sp.]|nr:RagB/SusD family nutrient uptake outer membrane protein [Prevotella sp.]